MLAGNTTFNPVILSGGTLSSDSTYFYRTFLSSETLSVSGGQLTADILIIGGGGSAGHTAGGGGGAGGVVYAESKILDPASYFITIGAGGAAGTFDGSDGNPGISSSISSINLVANGGGAGAHGGNGYSGGSGGGAGYNNQSIGGVKTQTSGSGYTGFGNNGGGQPNSGGIPYRSGGGGGAGEAGQNTQSSTVGGRGGNGLALWSNWALATGTGVLNSADGLYYYAGGGGGSTAQGQTTLGGHGGGGRGGYAFDNNSLPGVINTGSGSGGGRYVSIGAPGGSGIVIVRYLK